MSGKIFIRILEEHGWYLKRISGSHFIMAKEGMRTVSVPVHGNKDLQKGTLSGLLKQANLKNEGYR